MARARKTGPTEPAATPDGGSSMLPALVTLEERVRAAAGELSRLRAANAELQRRGEELEGERHAVHPSAAQVAEAGVNVKRVTCRTVRSGLVFSIPFWQRPCPLRRQQSP